MKKTIVAFASVAMLVCASSAANATLVAYWNFNSGSSTTSGLTPAPASVFDVTEGSGALTFTGGDPDNVVTFAGTVTNLPDPDPDGTGRGVALAVRNGVDNANENSYLEFSLDMTGLQDLVMSYAVQRTSTGFTDNTISYSTMGGPFVEIITFDDLLSSFGSTSEVPGAINTVDFSSVLDINNSSDVRIRLAMSGGAQGATNGNNRIDNVQFNAAVIPEPTSLVLMLVGLAGVAMRRRS